jgi:hypothetical protein
VHIPSALADFGFVNRDGYKNVAAEKTGSPCLDDLTWVLAGKVHLLTREVTLDTRAQSTAEHIEQLSISHGVEMF